jgi:UDP-N-acetylmuramate dehydrogenase
MTIVTDISIQHDAPLPTWFKIGGRAERFAAPAHTDALRQCLELDPSLRVLGDGANLLVDDDGVPELVVSLARGFSSVVPEEGDWSSGRLHVGSGVNLPKLIIETGRRGLAGLEGLGGIPATVGGAVIMNAGGAFGEIASAVARVHAMDRSGNTLVLNRSDIPFAYRTSGLAGLIVTGVDLALTPQADPAALRDRLKEVMAYKARSQPMAASSAGCCFKNPTLAHDLRVPGPNGTDEFAAGTRVGAGLLIDRAGLKGLSVGGASVSDRHANFLVTAPGASARDVICLLDEIVRRVQDRFGVRLEREVVVWSRHA